MELSWIVTSWIKQSLSTKSQSQLCFCSWFWFLYFPPIIMHSVNWQVEKNFETKIQTCLRWNWDGKEVITYRISILKGRKTFNSWSMIFVDVHRASDTVRCKGLENLINIERLRHGLPRLRCSKVMRKVAQKHVLNQFNNNFKPSRQCNLHSWAGSRQCCYHRDHSNSECMWRKPFVRYGFIVSLDPWIYSFIGAI